MELVGNEKRIRALFSELSVADQSRAPRFEKLWHRVENTTPAPVRNFRRPAVAFAAAVFIAACALAVWSWSHTTSTTDNNAVIPPQLTTPTPAPAVAETNDAASPRQIKRSHTPRKKRIERYQPTDPAITEAAMLWSWQSPTSILMQSPTTLVFNSLPQLNQSVEELKQFLPKDHEVKESNQ
jgi:hypothetical protein